MAGKPLLLIVEDDAAIRELLTLHFEQAGFRTAAAADGRSALQWLAELLPDAVVVDWMLPDQSGLALVGRLRRDARTRALPIVMLTARASEEDKVRGLEEGADDYVTKPFSPRELVARVRAVIRRRRPEADPRPVEFGGLHLIPEVRQASYGGRSTTLGPTEFRLLHFLVTHPERVWERSTLLDRVWGDHVFIEERTVDVHIRRLRLALTAIGAEGFVQTVRGVGYRLAAPQGDDRSLPQEAAAIG
ncbi:MAG: phosphate regulon transcriptional regulator PhoB [Hydrogenophilus sp.]|nr:phosphate regulon transcriptional regulator PhoB [Hydrogenophilus sp.]